MKLQKQNPSDHRKTSHQTIKFSYIHSAADGPGVLDCLYGAERGNYLKMDNWVSVVMHLDTLEQEETPGAGKGFCCQERESNEPFPHGRWFRDTSTKGRWVTEWRKQPLKVYSTGILSMLHMGDGRQQDTAATARLLGRSLQGAHHSRCRPLHTEVHSGRSQQDTPNILGGSGSLR